MMQLFKNTEGQVYFEIDLQGKIYSLYRISY